MLLEELTRLLLYLSGGSDELVFLGRKLWLLGVIEHGRNKIWVQEVW